MRNCKCFMQIQMTNISTNVTRELLIQPVHSCSRHPYKPVRHFMNNLSNLFNGFFKHTMREWISDHQCLQDYLHVVLLLLSGLQHQYIHSPSHFTTTTFIPAITADAGFVPCAEIGIKITLRCTSSLFS